MTGTTPGRAPQLVQERRAAGGALYLRQWWTLTVRGLLTVLRNGEFVFAFIAPAFVAVCFYIPLRKVMDSSPNMDYATFLTPIILLMSISFAATSAAMRSAFDVKEGINARFRVLPMPGAVPFLSRQATNTVLLVVSLVCSGIACLLIGWRPSGGVLGTIGLFGVALLIGALLSLLSDGVGLVAGSPEATSQMLGLPTMILGMVSTGFVPEAQFPEWIRGFARNQPISQFVSVMRAADSPLPLTWSTVQASVWWSVGLAIAAGALLLKGSRKVAG